MAHKPISEMEYLDYDERDDVGMWIIHDFAKHFDSPDFAEGETHFRETASDDRMNAAVVVMENAQDMGREMKNSLDHINEQWTELSDAVDIDRIAYVADGMMGSAVKAKVEADVEAASFKDLDEAVAWAQEV